MYLHYVYVIHSIKCEIERSHEVHISQLMEIFSWHPLPVGVTFSMSKQFIFFCLIFIFYTQNYLYIPYPHKRGLLIASSLWGGLAGWPLLLPSLIKLSEAIFSTVNKWPNRKYQASLQQASARLLNPLRLVIIFFLAVFLFGLFLCRLLLMDLPLILAVRQYILGLCRTYILYWRDTILIIYRYSKLWFCII